MIKVLIEGGGLKPVTAKLLDFDDAVMVLGMPDGNQWMIDMAYVIQVADAEGEETAAGMAEAE